MTTPLGRTTVGLYQTPSGSNGWTMILDFNDGALGGSAGYLAHVTVEYPAAAVPEPASPGLFTIRRWRGSR